MTRIGKLNVGCNILKGLKYGAILNNENSSIVQPTICPVQPSLNSFLYNSTLNNDNCFALKYKILENPKDNLNIRTKFYSFVPYRSYHNKLKVIKIYNNKLKG